LKTEQKRGSTQLSGVTRGLSQGKNLAERGPLASTGAALVNTKKKLRNDGESGVDADGYAKTLNHRKYSEIAEKQQPTENLTNTKIDLLANWEPVFLHLGFQGGHLAPVHPRLVITPLVSVKEQ